MHINCIFHNCHSYFGKCQYKDYVNINFLTIYAYIQPWKMVTSRSIPTVIGLSKIACPYLLFLFGRGGGGWVTGATCLVKNTSWDAYHKRCKIIFALVSALSLKLFGMHYILILCLTCWNNLAGWGHHIVYINNAHNKKLSCNPQAYYLWLLLFIVMGMYINFR